MTEKSIKEREIVFVNNTEKLPIETKRRLKFSIYIIQLRRMYPIKTTKLDSDPLYKNY